MYNECFLHMSKMLQKESNCAGKNEFVSQHTCLQPLFSLSNIKDNKIINNYHVPHTHINSRKR